MWRLTADRQGEIANPGYPEQSEDMMPVNRPPQIGEQLEILSLVICRREFIAGTVAIHDELMPAPFPPACLDQTHLLLVRCIAIDHLLNADLSDAGLDG
ncbi:hypothetical protein [Laribacter hongkongensis]|uniref:hypothetical protein n=1 Tax=Laribacter hongkongensis TaxID=168471 RepID=UPI001EFDE3E2|nr:hypothetical protein [Laribacter hongkongensis]MCG9058093.1 hypothetical protein [Laribacter hongkongensis]MCG9084445.1 hypothetical protein [Laribacter hongkongensis]MCG9097576.1 hypothetical protein [Laribacter hongkongensis]